MGEQKEKYKIIVIAALLAICCFITYYFHVVLSAGIVFTHFFYIPIILASLWWRRKGLGVAIFLALLLIFSHFFIRMDMGTINDLIRATMFIVVALVTAILSERIAIRDRSETAFKSGEVLDDETLNIYTPTLKQLDNVTPIHNIEDIGKYAECPYCGSNIRETFYEHGGIVRCDKCGAFHHKECFEYYGNKCGSSSCKLGNA